MKSSYPPEPMTPKAQHRILTMLTLAVLSTGPLGCDGGDGGAPPTPPATAPATGLGAEAEAIVTEAWVPIRASNTTAEGDTLAVWAARGTPFEPASMLVTSLDPVYADLAPIKRLDVSGVAHVGVDDEFVVWMGQPSPDLAPPRIHYFEMANLEDPAANAQEWKPYADDDLRMTCLGFADGWVGFIGRSGDALSGRQQVGLADFRDDFGGEPVVLGEYEVARGACAMTARAFVWVAEGEIHVQPVPFDEPDPIVIGGVSSGLERDLPRVEGGLLTWRFGGELHLFDVDRAFVDGENPRSLGDRLLLDQTSRYVVHGSLDGARAFVVDGTDLDWPGHSVYAADEPEELKPRLGGRYVVYSACRKVWRGLFDVPDCADGRDDEPPFLASLFAIDLEDPDRGIIPVASPWRGGRVALGELGLLFSGSDGLTYWNPREPFIEDVNPLPIFSGGSAVRTPAEWLGTDGVFWSEDAGGVEDGDRFRRYRFIDAVRLLLATRDDS